jgi:hypothetical protein
MRRQAIAALLRYRSPQRVAKVGMHELDQRVRSLGIAEYRQVDRAVFRDHVPSMIISVCMPKPPIGFSVRMRATSSGMASMLNSQRAGTLTAGSSSPCTDGAAPRSEW